MEKKLGDYTLAEMKEICSITQDCTDCIFHHICGAYLHRIDYPSDLDFNSTDDY